MAEANDQNNERALSQLWIILGLTAIGLVLLALRAVVGRRRNDFPGPLCLPLLGSIGPMWCLSRTPDKELYRLKDEWGSVCALQVGPQPALLISSPRIAKELLNERGSIYSSRPELDPFRKQILPWRLVTLPHGPGFRLIRKLYNNYLSAQHSLRFRKYQDHESRVMLQGLLHQPDEFLRNADRYTMSVIFSAVYGVRINSLDHPLMKELHHIWHTQMECELMIALTWAYLADLTSDFLPGTLPTDFLPFLLYLPKFLQPWHKKLMPLTIRELEIHRAFIRRLRESIQTGSAPDCFGKLVLEAQEKENVSDSQLYGIFAMFIIAGTDTTAGVLQHFFKIMALNPHVVRKAHEELDRVVGPGRLPDWQDEQSLVYVRSLIKELHRYNPLDALGVPHYAMKDDIYEGKLIKKDTLIIPNIPALSRDPERYPDADKFNPDRFKGDLETAAVSAVSQDHMKRDHFHFGFGRRICPGIHVAEASLFIAISRLLWAYDIKPRQGCPLKIDPMRPMLVWKPDPYQVDIVCRGESYEKLIRQVPAGNGIAELAEVEIK